MHPTVELLRELADRIESGEFLKPQERPEGFVPIDAPRPEIGPDEAWWAWWDRTGKTVIELDGDRIVKIDRPLVEVGVVRGPAPK